MSFSNLDAASGFVYESLALFGNSLRIKQLPVDTWNLETAPVVTHLLLELASRSDLKPRHRTSVIIPICLLVCFYSCSCRQVTYLGYITRIAQYWFQQPKFTSFVFSLVQYVIRTSGVVSLLSARLRLAHILLFVLCTCTHGHYPSILSLYR